MRQMEFRRVRRRWPGVTSQLLYMTCRAFMRRNEDLPAFRYTSSCPSCLMCALLMDVRHPSATVILRRERERASKDARPRTRRDRRPFEALASLGHLRVTVSMSAARRPFGIFRILTLSTLSIVTSPLVSARRSARGSSRFLVPTPNEGGGGAPRGAHWVFDHAGEARCRVNGTRRSRCDRDRAPRRSTVAISGRGTTLQLRQCPPDPRCDLPAGPIARPGRLGPVPPAPRFATVGHGTPRPAPSVGSSPETPLMSENESGVA